MIKDTILNTAAEILENWGMFLVDRANSSLEIFEVDEPFLLAELDFKGVVNGKYQILTQKKFAELLVSNLLGEEPENVDEQSAKDAVAELVNVMSGNLLTSQFGEEEIFDLTPPKVEIIDSEKAKTFFKDESFCYLADEMPVAVTCSVK